MIKTEK
jgi:hypothetical protein